jgi:hypothetical protein
MILNQPEIHKIGRSKIYVFDSIPRTFTFTNIKVLSSSKSCVIFTYLLGPILLYIPTTSFYCYFLMYFLVYKVYVFHEMLERDLLCSSICGPGLIGLM